MDKLEHLDQRWTVGPVQDYGTVIMSLASHDKPPWYVCKVAVELPGDPTGELTARAICDEHNAALDAKLSAPTTTPVQMRRSFSRPELIDNAIEYAALRGSDYYADLGLLVMFVDSIFKAETKEASK